jgi:predicted AAA+ superfamily ATPase
MLRFAYYKLLEWCKTPNGSRKPLLMEGARQVGKTWLVRELGANEFENYIELNFEKETALRSLFELDFNLERIFLAISAFSGKTIVPGKTLVFFDEIQWAPRGLLALKYFENDAKDLHVVAAGSLLGVIDHKGDSFPVGKISFLKIYPMNYAEFLLALGKNKLYEILRSCDWQLINVFGNQYENILRQYFFVGGMPEAVQKFIDTGDYTKVRKIQRELVKSFKRDFSKHPPSEVISRIHLVWDSIPAHLSKENKKFIYSAVRTGARAKDFETAIQWLKDAGIIYKLTRVSAGESPLKGFENESDFKIFVVDIGILGAMCSLNQRTLIDGTNFYKQYKGALTEQFVMQELAYHMDEEDMSVHYWSPDTGIAELDFVLEYNAIIAPLEAKAQLNLKAKSLKSFCHRYKTSYVFRTSLSPYRKNERITDIPLYAVSNILKIMSEDPQSDADKAAQANI